MDYKQVFHEEFANRAKITWNDTNTVATVLLVAESKKAFALTMPRQILEHLRADIADALARKP